MKTYRVHVHDYSKGRDHGAWLASADFGTRPFGDEIGAAFPLLRVPGRYEIRVNVVDSDGDEHGLSTWLQDAAPERVIFRRWKTRRDGHSVIALFPDMAEPGTGRTGMVTSFEHDSQHGAADLSGVISRTRPARHQEYIALKDELEAAPYRYKLHVIQRTPKTTNEPFNVMTRTDPVCSCGDGPHTDDDPHC